MNIVRPFPPVIRTVSDATLKKYGLELLEWLELYHLKDGCCHACGRPFEDKRINIDHAHVRGWKQMAPAERKKYIRGLLCYTCNRFVTMRGMSSDRLFKAYQYLRNYEVRITADALHLQQVHKRGANKPRNARHQQADPQPDKA